MVEFQFPFVLVRTKRGLASLDRLGRIAFLRKIGSVSVVIMPLIGAVMIFFLINAINNMLISPYVSKVIRELGPAVNILLPGLNPYLPVFYGWVALFLAMIIHEYSHGVQARVNGMNVKSMGIVLFLIIPIGAFAEVDEKQLEEAGLSKAGRVLSTGPVSNILTAFAALAIFILLISSLKPVVNGVLVVGLASNGSAYKAGMRAGDIIVGVNNHQTPDWKTFTNIINDTYRSGGNITFMVLRNCSSNYAFTLKTDHNSARILDFLINDVGLLDSIPLKDVLDSYSSAIMRSPIEGISIYLMIPTIPFPWVYKSIPFSNLLQKYYTSILMGDDYHYFVNLFFWIWFINFNLGIFNSLPLYPMDGGVVFKLWCRKKLSGRISSKLIDKMVYAVNFTILCLIIGIIVIPYFIR